MKRLSNFAAMFILSLNLLMFKLTGVYADVAPPPKVVGLSSPAITIMGLIILIVCVASFLLLRWIKNKNDHQ